VTGGPATRAYVLLALAAGLGCGCQRPGASSARRTERTPAAEGRPGALKVALPEGWVPQSGPDGSFHAGPPARPVLRIDRFPDAGGLLPGADGLRMAFTQGLRSLSVEGVNATQTEDYGAAELSLGRADAGVRALLGAKRWGGDLFLCATEPGTSAAEVAAANRACASIGVGAGP
jgi:hypothetical protein